MKTITYNKLVRDKIPEIIEAGGREAVYETLGDQDYLNFLKAKLIEEVTEFNDSESLEELADIGEVMHAILDYKGISLEQFQKARQEKLEKRGGFKRRLLLKETIEK